MLNKNTLTFCASVFALWAGSMSLSADSKLSATSTLAFESEYIFRGEQLAGSSFQPSLDLAYPVLGGQLYGGVWFSTEIESTLNNNEIDYYAGYTQQITNAFSVDLGVTFYDYPNGTGADDESEVYFGLIGDFALSPALYFYYNADLKQYIAEASLSHSIDLSELLAGTSLELGVYGGLVEKKNTAFGEDDSWFYYGATADLVYQVNDTASLSLGGRLAGNNKSSSAKDEFAWFGFSTSFGF